MKHSDNQLQCALVSALPQSIGVRPEGWFWKSSCISGAVFHTVTDQEWPFIVQLVEDKLSDLQVAQYDCMLSRGAQSPAMASRMSICSKWQARAEALAAMGVITVTPEADPPQ